MVPNSKKVFIGEKEFELKELTCLRRNVLLDIVGSFTFADIMKSIYPLLGELGIKLDEGDEDESITKLIKLALQDETIWGGLMACLITVLDVGPQVICLSICETEDKEDELYIRNNITISQEPIVIKKIIELNKLPETVKNYRSLLTEIRGLIKVANS